MSIFFVAIVSDIIFAAYQLTNALIAFAVREVVLILSNILVGVGFLLVLIHLTRFDLLTPFGQRIRRLGRWWLIFFGATLLLLSGFLALAIFAFGSFALGSLFSVVVLPFLYLLFVEPIRLPAAGKEEKQLKRALLAIPLSYLVLIVGNVLFFNFFEFFIINAVGFNGYFRVLIVVNAVLTSFFLLTPIFLLSRLSLLKDSQTDMLEEDLELYKQNTV